MLTLEFERLGVRAGDVLVDLGCGNGRHTFEALKRGAHVIAADLKPEVLTHVTEWVTAMYEQGEIPAAGVESKRPTVDELLQKALAHHAVAHTNQLHLHHDRLL